jgi:hypothetical protein
MEVIMDYHLFFMAVAWGLFIFTIVLLFINNTKEQTIAAMILCGLNYVICMICSLGFFGIGIPGIDSSGNAVITAHHDMMAFYTIFFLLYWINIVFLFYCYWMWTRNPWTINETGSSEIKTLK